MDIEFLELRTKHPFIIARGGQSDYRTCLLYNLTLPTKRIV
jgi:hypothetical protein